MRTFYDDVADPPQEVCEAIWRWSLTRRGGFAYAHSEAERDDSFRLLAMIGAVIHVPWNNTLWTVG